MSTINKIKFNNVDEQCEPVYKVYIITDGKKIYVGKTKSRLKQRIQNHISASFNVSSHHYIPRVHSYFKTRWEDCVISIVCDCKNEAEMNRKEIEIINNYKGDNLLNKNVSEKLSKNICEECNCYYKNYDKHLVSSTHIQSLAGN